MRGGMGSTKAGPGTRQVLKNSLPPLSSPTAIISSSHWNQTIQAGGICPGCPFLEPGQ